MGHTGVPEQITQVVTKPSGVKEYQISDHLASLRVGIEGGTQRHIDYDPWGNPTGAVTGERQTFNCQERDRENAFFDLSDRNYDPNLGRFVRPDRLWEQSPSFSPYHYCENNPLRLTDPEGMQALRSEEPEYQIPWYLRTTQGAIERIGYSIEPDPHHDRG